MSGLFVLLRWLTLRHFARHRLRSLLALGSVALGVATCVAMSALNRSTLESFEATARQQSGGADLVVRGRAATVPAALLDECRSVAGVRRVVPLLWRFHFTRDRANDWHHSVLLLGTDPAALEQEGELEDWLLEVASPLQFAHLRRPVLVNEVLAREQGLAVGDALEVSTAAGFSEVQVAGVVRRQEQLELLSPRWIVAALPLAQELCDADGALDRILVYCDDAAAARVALEEVVGARAVVADPLEDARDYDAVLGSLRMALGLISVLSLVIAAFLVHSTLAMALAERRVELATLRCLGMPAKGMQRLLLLEALGLGLVGALPGLLLGVVLARLLGEVFWSTVGSTFDRVAGLAVFVQPAELVFGLLAGVLAALASVWLAARSAARQPPLAGLREQLVDAGAGICVLVLLRRLGPLGRRAASHPLLARRGAVMIAAALVAVAAVLVAGEGFGIPRAAYLAIVALVLALVIGAYPTLSLLSRRSGRLLLRLGPGARLARDHFERSSTATNVTLVAISLGFGLVATTHMLVHSFEDLLEHWFDRTIREDLFVFGHDFLEGGLDGARFDAALANDLRALPGVLHVHPMRFRRVAYQGERVMIMALDGAAPEVAGHFDYREGSRSDRERLDRSEGVFVSGGFAVRFGVGRGDRIDLPVPGAERTLEVLAVVEDYTWPLGSVILDDAYYREVFADPTANEFAITFDGTRPPAAVKADVEALFAGRFPAAVRTRAEVIGTVFQTFREYWSVFLAQEALAIAVAFLGTLHTLLISVMLRRREIGLLRAVGARVATVRRMILLEGTCLGFAGGVLGLLFGTAMATISVRLLSLEEQGFQAPLTASAASLVAIVLVATLSGVLAGILPAREAARVPVLDALREDG